MYCPNRITCCAALDSLGGMIVSMSVCPNLLHTLPGSWALPHMSLPLFLLMPLLLQLVDRLDQGHPFAPTLSSGTGLSYQGLYSLVASAMYRTHVEGKLKSEIIQVINGCAGVVARRCRGCGKALELCSATCVERMCAYAKQWVTTNDTM